MTLKEATEVLASLVRHIFGAEEVEINISDRNDKYIDIVIDAIPTLEQRERWNKEVWLYVPLYVRVNLIINPTRERIQDVIGYDS